MHVILDKLWASKGTIAIVLWVAVFAWTYNLDWFKKPIIKQEVTRKTVEEIMAVTADNSPEPAWDTEFKSSIEAAQ